MYLMEVLERLGMNKTSYKARPMIDALESRAMRSVSPSTTANDAIAATGTFQTLSLKASVTSIKVYSNTSSPGEAVTITALVAGKTSTGIPAGTVTFLSGTTTIGTATLSDTGTAKISTTLIPAGTTVITAVYSGSSRFAASTSAGRGHIVQGLASTTKLSIANAAPLFGDAVPLVAHVKPASGTAVATGRVVFYDGTAVLGSHTLNSVGAARITASYLYVGAHDLKAIYMGSTSLLPHRSSVHTVTVATPALTTGSDGLSKGTIIPGTGAGAASGDDLSVNYTLYLRDTGTEIESGPFTFQLGAGQVIPGWDEGLVGATAGERRVLVVPPTLAYGSTARPNIPANSTLVFVINVLSITQN